MEQTLALRPKVSRRSRNSADVDCLDQSGAQAPHFEATGWSARPLCAQYLVVIFESQLVAIRTDAVRQHEVRWAIGVVADGQSEVLGAWCDSVPGICNWAAVFADLMRRGVKRIVFVLGDDSSFLSGAARMSYPATKVFPSVWTIMRRSAAEVALSNRRSARQVLSGFRTARSAPAARAMLTSTTAGPLGARYPSAIALWSRALPQLEPRYALTPSRQRCIRQVEDVAEKLLDGLCRATERRCCFAGQSEAARFVAEFLERADGRRRDADRVASMRRATSFEPQALGV